MRNKIIITSLLTLLISFNIYSQSASLKATLSINDINGEKVAFQNGIPLPAFEKQNRSTLNLEGEWKKFRFEADHDLSLSERTEEVLGSLQTEIINSYLPEFDDNTWENKNLPFVENEMYEFPTVPEYYENGIVYRKKFTVDNSEAGKNSKLIFYSVNYIADVWLNGEYIGYHEGGFTPFAFDVTKKLNYSGENTIVVRVDNIPWGKRKDIVPFYKCDWFNYAGIIGDVYLEFSNSVEVVRADVVPLESDGSISLKTVISNNSEVSQSVSVRTKIYNASINEANIKSEYATDLFVTDEAPVYEDHSEISLEASSVVVNRIETKIMSPRLWSHVDPNLYVLVVEVLKNNEVVDQFATQFGIRTVRTNGGIVELNNNPVFYTGVARHEDHPVYGRSLPKEVIFDDLELIKNSNINFLRSGHYPNAPYTYLIADRLGLAVMEEIPVWWFDNEPEWLIQNNDRLIHKQMFREMAFKDFNRPSIILWSTSNECKEEDNRIIYNQMIVDDIKQNYPDGRLVSQSSAGDNPGATDITQGPLDVAGWTLYFGIFHGSTYYAGTLNFMARAKSAFPGKPIIDTEFGYWSSENGSSVNEQVKTFEETFKALKVFAALREDGSYNPSGVLMATTWWCMFDWYSHQHPNGFQSMGLISMDRQTFKPVYTKLKDGYKPFFENGGMVVTGVAEQQESALPDNFRILQNYPNPFNAGTIIKFSVPELSTVKLDLYDIKGELIKHIADKEYQPGDYQVALSNMNLVSGVYFVRVQAMGIESSYLFSDTIKITLLK